MKTFKIAVIPGDGIGVDVTLEGIKVLDKYEELFPVKFDKTFFPWGCEYYLKHEKMMDDDGMDILKGFDAILLGAVGFPGVEDHVSLHGLLIKIRQGFDQYINLRPIKLLNKNYCPLKNKKEEDIDFVVIRENVEGEYSNVGGIRNGDKAEGFALQTSVFTRRNTERVMKYAYDLAMERKKILTSVTKSNALNYSMVFWDTIFGELNKVYNKVTTESVHVDALSMYFVQKPEAYDVVVGSNLFGDIITDLGAALQGGLGFAASANINPEKKYPSMFEPVHGSAPDIAGLGIANPIAMIWTIKLMMDHLLPYQDNEIIVNAIKKVVDEGKVLTKDMGGSSSTVEVADEIVNNIVL